MTAPLIAPVADDTDDSDLVHTYCTACSPNVALCGWEDDGDGWVDDWADEDRCVVCADLDRLPCPKCGAP
jgi:hypothetical protein